MNKGTPHTPWTRIVGWFLAVTYGVAAPFTAYVELQNNTLSERFGLPTWLILLTCAIQVVSALVILRPRYAPWAAGALTAVTFGAIASHVRIGSPLTAIPALLYTAMQVWYGWRMRDTASRVTLQSG